MAGFWPAMRPVARSEQALGPRLRRSSKAPSRRGSRRAPAPISGAMMNSQSCATAFRVRGDADQRRADRAGRIDRRAGDVDADEMDDDQRQADGEAGEAGRREGVRDAENADEEQERPDHLEDEGRDHVVFADIAGAPAVLAKPAVPALRLARQDEIEHGGADDRAEHLGDPVARPFRRRSCGRRRTRRS